MSAPATPNPEQAKGVTVEEIVSGTRCSPFTLKEFEGFLIHVSTSVHLAREEAFAAPEVACL